MFDLEASRIALVGSYLVARMPDDEGRMKDSEIDLNNYLGSNGGKLEWGGDRFFEGPGVSFLLEEGPEGPVLHATVRRGDGDEVESAIPLAERIRNENGNLVFSDESWTP